MSEHRAYRVTGRVQGVGFRWWARQTAARLGLRGIVRNEADGSVYLEAGGEADRLTELEAHLAAGPPGAAVTAVHPVEPRAGTLPTGFDIVR